MRAHPALSPGPHAVAFLGLGEHHGGPSAVVRRGVVGSVDLQRVVPAALQAIDIGVAHSGNELGKLGILVEELLAVEAPVGGGVGLELAIHGLVQPLEQDPVRIAGKERIPVRAPQQLHHVPAGAGEEALELLHDRAIAAHRPIEALQVAVDDEDQVVESFARGKRQAGERLRLVHLAVAGERPHLAGVGLREAAVLEIAHEARGIDRVDRTEAHRTGRKLPERRHEIRVAIRGQAFAPGFTPVMIQMVFRKAAFQEGPRIHARSGMRLEVHQISVRPAAEKVVEAYLEEIRRRGIARDMAAELGVRPVRAHHHGERVPAHDRRNALLQLQVARKLGLLRKLDRVLVGRVQHRRQRHAPHTRMVEELAQQEGGALASLGGDQCIEGLQPFARFDGVRVGRIDAPERGGNDVGKIGHSGMVACNR